MEVINEWEQEFPILKSLKKPKTFLLTAIVNVDVFLKKIIFWGTVLLSVYLMSRNLSDSISSGAMPSLFAGNASAVTSLKIYKTYRNLLFLILLIDLLPTLLVVIVHGIRGHIARLAKTLVNFVMLYLFVIFSYAIFAVILDILMVLFTINKVLIK